MSPVESRDVLARLETKVDDLTQLVQRIVLLEDRQVGQGVRIGSLEQAMTALLTRVETNHLTSVKADAQLERQLDRWVNRGLGVWAVILVVFALANSSAIRMLVPNAAGRDSAGRVESPPAKSTPLPAYSTTQ